MKFNIIAICDGSSFEIIEGGSARVKLLEAVASQLKQWLKRDIKLKYDMNKEEIEAQGYNYKYGLYSQLQMEYESLAVPGKPHIKFWE